MTEFIQFLVRIAYVGVQNPRIWVALFGAIASVIGYQTGKVAVEELAALVTLVSSLVLPALPARFKKDLPPSSPDSLTENPQ